MWLSEGQMGMIGRKKAFWPSPSTISVPEIWSPSFSMGCHHCQSGVVLGSPIQITFLRRPTVPPASFYPFSFPCDLYGSKRFYEEPSALVPSVLIWGWGIRRDQVDITWDNQTRGGKLPAMEWKQSIKHLPWSSAGALEFLNIGSCFILITWPVHCVQTSEWWGSSLSEI